MKELKDLEGLSWSQVRNFNEEKLPSPVSVHIPLNQPLARELIYCDRALNVYVLPMPENMRVGCAESSAIRSALRLTMCQFALGNPAFIPCFQQVKAERKKGNVNAVVMTFFALRLLYSFEYCTDGGNNIWIRVTVENTGLKELEAHVRTRLTHPREQAQFPFQYVPYAWDASEWLPDDGTIFCLGKEGSFYNDRGKCAQAYPGDFMMEHEKYRRFSPEEYNHLDFSDGDTYWVRHNYQLLDCRGTLHFSTILQPGEKKSFEICVKAEAGSPQAADYRMAEEENLEIWKRRMAGMATVDFGTERENRRFESIRNCTFQLLTDRNGQLQPSQGGAGERVYVWVWEAMCELSPMAALGSWDEIRRVLEFILSLQDGGVPPQGEFTSVKGAIGTTGPRWINSTGSALFLASEYLLKSGDLDFWHQYGDNLLRAADWILGEIRATKVPGAVNYGLMPKGCATDEDYGYAYAWTDAFSWSGLNRFCQVLRKNGSEAYDRVARETVEYRKNIHAAMERCSRSDGFIDRKLSDEGKIDHGFRNICGALNLLGTDCCSALEPKISRLIDYQEQHCFKGPFCAPMTHDVHYVGPLEGMMLRCYIQRGEYKKAWTVAECFRTFAMTSDLFLTQERYCESTPEETCWQPNASNNGRFLEMALNTLYYACDNTIYLLCGIAPFEYDDRAHFRIANLHTDYGLMNMKVAEERLALQWENPLPPGTEIVLPNWFENGLITLQEATSELNMKLVRRN